VDKNIKCLNLKFSLPSLGACVGRNGVHCTMGESGAAGQA
jgi:hypothetical protein